MNAYKISMELEIKEKEVNKKHEPAMKKKKRNENIMFYCALSTVCCVLSVCIHSELVVSFLSVHLHCIPIVLYIADDYVRAQAIVCLRLCLYSCTSACRVSVRLCFTHIYAEMHLYACIKVYT